MAITDGRITFLDFMKATDPTGKRIMTVAEVLNQNNPALQDGTILPSNADLGHRVTLRTGLPVVSTGKINKGVPRSKSTTEQRTESMALFVGRSEIDVRNKKMFGQAKYNMKRASEDLTFSESFAQFITQTFLYGSINGDEASFNGIATRTPALQTPGPGVGASQVWSNGTVTGGDGASMFICDWGERGVHWIYPQEDAKNGGLEVDDKGETPVADVDGNPFFADVTEFDWSIGIAVEDPRRIARLANIDVSDANLGTGMVQGRIADRLLQILGRMPPKAGYNRIIYAPVGIITAFQSQVSNVGAGVPLTLEQYLGEKIPHYMGNPIRQLDQASMSESTIS